MFFFVCSPMSVSVGHSNCGKIIHFFLVPKQKETNRILVRIGRNLTGIAFQHLVLKLGFRIFFTFLLLICIATMSKLRPKVDFSEKFNGDGTQSADAFIKKFERMAPVAEWSEDDMVKYFLCHWMEQL